MTHEGIVVCRLRAGWRSPNVVSFHWRKINLQPIQGEFTYEKDHNSDNGNPPRGDDDRGNLGIRRGNG